MSMYEGPIEGLSKKVQTAVLLRAPSPVTSDRHGQSWQLVSIPCWIEIRGKTGEGHDCRTSWRRPLQLSSISASLIQFPNNKTALTRVSLQRRLLRPLFKTEALFPTTSYKLSSNCFLAEKFHFLNATKRKKANFLLKE